MKELAIITICYNDREGLERTLASVAEQTIDAVEHFVVDGGSTDGSVEVIKAHGARLTRWVSEPDEGIYHAQNKGWSWATAPWVLFLNAGDTLDAPTVIEQVLPFLRSVEYDVQYGDLRVLRTTGPDQVKHYPPRISSAWLMKESVPHPAQFTRRSLLQELGGFDLQFKIAADYDFFARAFWKRGIRTRKLPFVVSTFDTTGLSSTDASKERLWQERRTIQRRHAPSAWYVLYQTWAAFNRLIGR